MAASDQQELDTNPDTQPPKAARRRGRRFL
jgi:hypothetical protein